MHTPAPALRRYITTRELQQMLAVSKATVARMLAAGHVGPQPIRVGPGQRHLRFLLPDVEAWLRSRQPNGTLPDRQTWLAQRKGGAA